MQATKGDNTAERPMWAEKGGLDFDGRAKWDGWSAVKGMKPEKAKLNFVKVSYTSGHSSSLPRQRSGCLVNQEQNAFRRKCGRFTLRRDSMRLL